MLGGIWNRTSLVCDTAIVIGVRFAHAFAAIAAASII